MLLLIIYLIHAMFYPLENREGSVTKEQIELLIMNLVLKHNTSSCHWNHWTNSQHCWKCFTHFVAKMVQLYGCTYSYSQCSSQLLHLKDIVGCYFISLMGFSVFQSKNVSKTFHREIPLHKTALRKIFRLSNTIVENHSEKKSITAFGMSIIYSVPKFR